MSTKTTFKRVALVAVAALGLGVLTSVAPATAIQRAGTSVTVGTPGVFAPGVRNTIPVTFTLPAGTVIDTDTITVIARITSAPAASNTVGSPASGSVSAVTSAAATSSTFYWGLASSGSGSNGVLTAGSTTAGFNAAGQAADGSNNYSTAATYGVAGLDLAGQITLRLNFVPDVAGSYTILFTSQPAGAAITNENAARQSTATLAGYTAASVTITTGAPATTVALSSRATSSPTGTSSNTGGVLLKVVPNTPLSGAESITLTSSSTTVTFSDSVLTADNFSTGSVYVNVHNSAAETVSVTATQSGTLTTLTPSSIALTYVTDSTQGAPTIGVDALDTTYATGTTSGGDTGLMYDVRTNRTSFPIKVSYNNAAGTAAFKTSITITDDANGRITGKANGVFSVPVSIAAAGTSATVTISAANPLLDEQKFTAVLNTSVTASDTLVIAGETAAVTTVAVTPSLTVRAADKSTNTFTATFKDQFGSVVANEAVTVTLTGRNAAASSTLVTNALGQVTHSVTDAGTAGTTDSLSFTSSTASSVTKTVTITYGTSVVTTMTLTGGNTTAGVTSTVLTVKDIDAGIDGASTTTHAFVATLKDAAGALMAGVPVTWTISGTTAAVTSTTKTVYSAADGTATAAVYGWAAGTYTVTATAGATTATGTITFGQLGAGEARVLTVTVNGQVITAKVVDRYGNVVPGVALYAVKSAGTGYFGAGLSKTTDTTDANGIATFAVAGGDASVTVSTINWTSAPGTVGSGQTAAPKGFSGYSATAAGQTALALTATTVGTTALDETGIGASFDAAGVSSVAVTVAADTTAADNAQAATDAAAEATDAANAATDAANAAAEAADAATAAAQDAADAVAALSTQVSEMVDALKKQITALTNLVIKIQKKVRA
jgi:trimeric autotransporter adhesin